MFADRSSSACLPALFSSPPRHPRHRIASSMHRWPSYFDGAFRCQHCSHAFDWPSLRHLGQMPGRLHLQADGVTSSSPCCYVRCCSSEPPERIPGSRALCAPKVVSRTFNNTRVPLWGLDVRGTARFIIRNSLKIPHFPSL